MEDYYNIGLKIAAGERRASFCIIDKRVARSKCMGCENCQFLANPLVNFTELPDLQCD